MTRRRMNVGPLLVLLAGCGGNSGPTVNATGVVYDVDVYNEQKLAGATNDQALAASVKAGLVVFADVNPGQKSAPTAADGSFTLRVPENSMFHIIVDNATDYVATLNAEPLATQAADIQVGPMITCERSGAETSFLATGAGLDEPVLLSKGFAVFPTTAGPPPPNDIPVPGVTVTVDGPFQVYAFNGSHVGGVVAEPNKPSALALYALVPTATLSGPTIAMVHVTDPTGAHTFPASAPVLVTPNFFNANLVHGN